jgi:hypothetical protein
LKPSFRHRYFSFVFVNPTNFFFFLFRFNNNEEIAPSTLGTGREGGDNNAGFETQTRLEPRVRSLFVFSIFYSY